MLSRVLDVVNLDSQIGLTDTEALSYSARGHPDVNPKAGHICLPNILLYIKLGHVL